MNLEVVPDVITHADGHVQYIDRVVSIQTPYRHIASVDRYRRPNVQSVSMHVPQWFCSRLASAAMDILTPKDDTSSLTCHQFAVYMRTGKTLDQEAAHIASYEQAVQGGVLLARSHDLSPETGAQEALVRIGQDATGDPNDLFYSMVVTGDADMRLHVVAPHMGMSYDRAHTPRDFYCNKLDKMASFITNAITKPQ
ncbi:MAG TPA: hypothetical protein VLF43_04010 [Candidatus Saccharimonadales bacterium]|nr:hypothetical protein [Candidatus Saccharimonadales bacterium]